MAYSTQSDILEQLSEAELIGLTDDEGSGDIVDTVVDRAISDADEEIDGYIGGRMELPLDPAPGIIRKWSVDIALWNLYSRRHDSCPEIREKRYNNALKALVMVAEGKLTLGQSDPEGNPPVNSGVAYFARDQVMTSTKLDRF